MSSVLHLYLCLLDDGGSCLERRKPFLIEVSNEIRTMIAG
jgi:hypothetical protein